MAGIYLFGLICVFLAVITWYKPNLILPILIFLTPLQRFNIFIESLNFSLKFIIVYLVTAYLVILLRKREFLRWNRKILIIFVVVLISEAVSLIASINQFRTLSVVAFSFLTFSFAYLLYLLIRTKQDLINGMKYLVFSGAIVSLLSIIQFIQFLLTGSVHLPLENLFGSKTITFESFIYDVGGKTLLRPSSTFVDVNLAAGFLAITAIVGGAYLFHKIKSEGLEKSGTYVLLWILNLTAFLMTISRSGYLGSLVGVLVFIFINWKQLLDRRIIGLITALVVFGGAIVLTFDTPIDAMVVRLKTTFVAEDTTGSTQEHVRFSKSAWDIFKKHKLLGIGAGNFEQYYLENIDPGEDTAYTYNIYLSFLSETGIIGFLSQIALISYVIVEALRRLIMEREFDKMLFSSLLCGLIAILVSNLFYSYYILFFVWLLFGLIFAYVNLPNQKKLLNI